MWKEISLPGLLLAAFLFVPKAEAITIGGEEYTKVLAFNSHDDLGYWQKGLKWFTFRGDNDIVRTNRIGTVTYRDDDLKNVQFNEVLAMGTYASRNITNTALTSGNVTLYGRNNEVLLIAQYVNNGNLHAIERLGTAGQLDVKGVYQVTGGSLFASSLLTGQLYIDIALDNVWRNNYAAGDIRANRGTYTFYEKVGETGGNEVPEPASMALLTSSLLAASRLKRKKQ